MHLDSLSLLESVKRTQEEQATQLRKERMLRDLGITKGPRDRSAGALRWVANRLEGRRSGAERPQPTT